MRYKVWLLGALPIDRLELTLNDQVGYISVARHWLDEGRLDSSIIYPSLLRRPIRRNSLYMPGFYLELALVYPYLGYSTLTSRVPALLSYLFACALLYWLARKLGGPNVALFATTLFAFFPLNLIYAFTAMAEIPLLAAGLAAFALFVWKRDTAAWCLEPLALALPIFFRETGVVLDLVMSAMLFLDGMPSTQRALACCAIAAAILAGLMLSPAGAGRPSMWKANILARGSFDAVYSDAFALDRLSGSFSDWTMGATHTFLANLHSLVSPQGVSPRLVGAHRHGVSFERHSPWTLEVEQRTGWFCSRDSSGPEPAPRGRSLFVHGVALPWRPFAIADAALCRDTLGACDRPMDAQLEVEEPEPSAHGMRSGWEQCCDLRVAHRVGDRCSNARQYLISGSDRRR